MVERMPSAQGVILEFREGVLHQASCKEPASLSCHCYEANLNSSTSFAFKLNNSSYLPLESTKKKTLKGLKMY